MTTSEYFTPNRNKINGVGIMPNYEVEFDYKTLDVDEQLNKAVEILKEKM